LEIEISKIIISVNRRAINQQKVISLADSIKDIGLQNAIVIKRNYELNQGLHRIEAFKLLGKDKIPANFTDLDGLKARLAEIDENLIRNEGTVLERSDWLAERKIIYEELHPETKAGGDRKSEEIKSKRNHFALIPTFADDTAQKTGVTPRTVQQEVQISTRIDKEVKEAIRDTPIADNKTELIKLARLKPEQQKEVAEKIVLGKAKDFKEAVQQKKVEETLQKEQTQAKSTQWPALIYKQSAVDFLNKYEDESIDLLLTDPPYSTDIDDLQGFIDSWVLLSLDKIKPTGRAYICTGAYPKELYAYLGTLLSQNKFSLENILVWTYRNTLGPSPAKIYKLNWQAIFYLIGPEAKKLDCPIMLEQFSVQDINAPDGRLGNRFHTWQKPDELAERFIKHSTVSGDTIIDPFAGTGTFILAGSRLGRKSFGGDIDNEMIKLAVQRGCVEK